MVCRLAVAGEALHAGCDMPREIAEPFLASHVVASEPGVHVQGSVTAGSQGSGSISAVTTVPTTFPSGPHCYRALTRLAD